MSTDPIDASTTLMGELLGSLRTDVSASAAVFLEFRRHGDKIVVSGATIDGELSNWWMMKDGVGPAGFDPDGSDDALSMREGQWTLEAPARRHFNRFCWLEEDIAQVAPWQRTSAYQSLYEANGIVDQYRAILVDHGKVVGWVGFLFDSSPRQRDLIETRVSNRLNEFRDIAKEDYRIPDANHRMLLDDKSELMALDPQAEETFDENTLRALRVQCRRQDTDERPTWYFDGYGVTPVPMRGEDGHATLLLIEPLGPVEINMRRALTSLQRRVAELVAEGNSNGEVAEVLGVSANTVKYHLKRIYPIVGVTNRVELATFLSS